MTRNRILLGLVALIILTGLLFDFETEIVNFCFAILLFFIELISYLKNRVFIKLRNRIVIKSYDWIGGLVFGGFMIFWFSDDTMNLWNISAIILVIASGLLDSLLRTTVVFTYDKTGIKNMHQNKLIPWSKIKEIENNNDSISIHTTEYRNDLVFHANKLKYPSWNELTKTIKEFAENEG